MKALNNKIRIRFIVTTGVFSAVAAALMMLSFSVPIMPSFIKLDFSELPALIAAYAMGPMAGVSVCFLKNLINLPFSTTGCVGELSNFLLGCLFVIPAGVLYKIKRNRKMAILGATFGALLMAIGSLPINYYLTYPIYSKFLPMESIIGMYQAIFPVVDNLFECLLIFNVPYTFVKGLLNAIIAFLIYKHISKLIKGK